MLLLLFIQSTERNLELISLKKWITNPVFISTSHHIHNITSGWQNWMAMLINVSFVASPPLWSRLTLTTHGEQLHWPAELIAPTQDNDCNSTILYVPPAASRSSLSLKIPFGLVFTGATSNCTEQMTRAESQTQEEHRKPGQFSKCVKDTADFSQMLLMWLECP